jgi:hypothetical protein
MHRGCWQSQFFSGLIMPPGQAVDIGQILSTLKRRGHVIVFRHVETDESQKDVYPFKFDDMSAQRQIADMAVSDRLYTLGIPVGVNPT